MLLIPAIDLRNGFCVRLLQGESDKETVYSNDPASMAVKFEEAGAKRLHQLIWMVHFKGRRQISPAFVQFSKMFPYQFK